MTIIIAIVVAIVSAFSKSFFDRIFAEYKPDIKKMKSRIISFALILLRYFIPFALIIFIYIKSYAINKEFVISITTLMFVFVFNIFYDLFIQYVNKKTKGQDEFNRMITDFLKILTEKDKSRDNDFRKMFDLLHNQSELTNKIITKIKNT